MWICQVVCLEHQCSVYFIGQCAAIYWTSLVIIFRKRFIFTMGMFTSAALKLDNVSGTVFVSLDIL